MFVVLGVERRVSSTTPCTLATRRVTDATLLSMWHQVVKSGECDRSDTPRCESDESSMPGPYSYYNQHNIQDRLTRRPIDSVANINFVEPPSITAMSDTHQSYLLCLSTIPVSSTLSTWFAKLSGKRSVYDILHPDRRWPTLGTYQSSRS